VPESEVPVGAGDARARARQRSHARHEHPPAGGSGGDRRRLRASLGQGDGGGAPRRVLRVLVAREVPEPGRRRGRGRGPSLRRDRRSPAGKDETRSSARRIPVRGQRIAPTLDAAAYSSAAVTPSAAGLTVVGCGPWGGRRLDGMVLLSAGRLPTQRLRISSLSGLVTAPGKHVPPDGSAVASARVLVPDIGGVVALVTILVPPAARDVPALGCSRGLPRRRHHHRPRALLPSPPTPCTTAARAAWPQCRTYDAREQRLAATGGERLAGRKPARRQPLRDARPRSRRVAALGARRSGHTYECADTGPSA
jgi:hypothetical protein